MVRRNEKKGHKNQTASPRQAMAKIKICDFEKISKIQADFGRERCGLCDLEKRVIWINSKQPKKALDTQGVILCHEKAHLMLHDLGIKWKARTAERFCDLYACLKATKKSLTPIEMMLRDKLLVSGNVWISVIALAHGKSLPILDVQEMASYWFWASQIKSYHGEPLFVDQNA